MTEQVDDNTHSELHNLSVHKQNISDSRHRNATTTPEMRQFIQESDFSIQHLSKILNISETTVRKWRKRNSIVNSSNTPHHLNTTLTPLQEYVVVGLRCQLKMPLDKLLNATQQFINPNVSRSGLARCLKRYGVSRIGAINSPEVPARYFNQLPITQGYNVKTYALHYETLAKTLALPSTNPEDVVQVVSVTIPPQLTEQQPHSVLLGIDPHSDWIYLDIYQDSNTQATNRYIAYVLRHGPFYLRKLLVSNYHQFLKRFPGATPNRRTTAQRPKTNKMTPPNKVSTGDSQ
ncbi:transcriptional regulator [Shewanella youngdeokensis]|uniref:Transcriptional regulator n=1 Tax=Shewanella youngdeokensis TaxID=2999068 RepID=A0ABZ0K0L1_9GAMM|nr:transcriptional regulator [Shewanella sp. DAU334]